MRPLVHKRMKTQRWHWRLHFPFPVSCRTKTLRVPSSWIILKKENHERNVSLKEPQNLWVKQQIFTRTRSPLPGQSSANRLSHRRSRDLARSGKGRRGGTSWMAGVCVCPLWSRLWVLVSVRPPGGAAASGPMQEALGMTSSSAATSWGWASAAPPGCLRNHATLHHMLWRHHTLRLTVTRDLWPAVMRCSGSVT